MEESGDAGLKARRLHKPTKFGTHFDIDDRASWGAGVLRPYKM